MDTARETAASNPWTIVLAETAASRAGAAAPARHRTITGFRSMLVHTLDRAVCLSPPERVVTVTSRVDQLALMDPHPALVRGRVLRQPAPRGTAAALYLALSYVRAVDPDAQVIVLPFTHHVHTLGAFVDQIRAASDACRMFDRIIAVGVEATSAAPECGWILPGRPLGRVSGGNVWGVEAFIDRPSRELAELVMINGGWWSTMILAAPLDRLWMVGCTRLPALLDRLAPLGPALAASDASAALDDAYRELPDVDLSRDLLHRLDDTLATIELRGITWVDWGQAHRMSSAPGPRPVPACLYEQALPAWGTPDAGHV